ncbi:MAG TPA: response regulator [bacterium]|nr:response regulator [bacterium]
MNSRSLGRPRYVLIVEENPHHAELITEVLDRHFSPIIINAVDSIEDALDFLGQSAYDIIITAGMVSGSQITRHLPKIVQIAADAPIIVISGMGDEKFAAEIIKQGAIEYLSKTRETLENLHIVLEKHFSTSGRRHYKKQKSYHGAKKSASPTPSEIIKEVDRLTQQALSIARPKKRKRTRSVEDIEQLDKLLGQIKKLRELASKLVP